jgi:hypothetical protein
MIKIIEPHTEDTPANHNTPGICHQCGRGGDLICPHCKSTDTEAEGLNQIDKSGLVERYRRLLMDAMSKKNTKYYIGCILIATGDPAAEGVSMADYAKAWGVTRAAVSQHCVAICTFLGMPPSEYMRSEAARDSYRKHNVRKVKVDK